MTSFQFKITYYIARRIEITIIPGQSGFDQIKTFRIKVLSATDIPYPLASHLSLL